MFARSVVSAVTALVCFFMLGVTNSRAEETSLDEKLSPRPLSLVLLGDSYSAGNGTGFYELDEEEADGKVGKDKAYRSPLNWANNYSRWLEKQRLEGRQLVPHLTNLAHSGNETKQVLERQIQKIPEDADLVMLTIGGNDIGFGDVVIECFVIGLRHPLDCKEKVEKARSIIRDPGARGLKARTKAVFDAIALKLDSMHRYDVDIILVSYPNLLLPNSATEYVLHECRNPFLPCVQPVEYEAGAEILETARELAKVQREAVAEWNHSRPPRPSVVPRSRYIGSIQIRFRQHEPDPSVLSKNNKRWINEFGETMGMARNDGITHSPPFTTGEPAEWYHPNITGHQQISKALEEEIGVPRMAKLDLPPNSSPNADPNARAPEPMLAWIQGPYAHEIGKELALDATGSYSTEGKIVKYEWDLDGDKKYDRTATGPKLTYTWQKEFVGEIGLRITSDTGATAEGSTRAMITNDGDSTPYARDNCPEVNNHGQTDYDKDGIGDLCDPTPGYPTKDRPGVGEGRAPVPSPSPSSSPSPAPLPTPTTSTSPSASAIPSLSPSASPTQSPSPKPTKTPSPKPSKTPSTTPTPSVSPSVTASPTPSVPPSPSVSPSVEPSVTMEPTVSPSESGSPLPTMTPSASPTEIPSPTATAAPTVTEPPIVSPDPTVGPVPTTSPTGVPPVLPSPTSAPVPTTPQPTVPEPPGVPVPSRPVPPDPGRPRPGLPNTGV